MEPDRESDHPQYSFMKYSNRGGGPSPCLVPLGVSDVIGPSANLTFNLTTTKKFTTRNKAGGNDVVVYVHR